VRRYHRLGDGAATRKETARVSLNTTREVVGYLDRKLKYERNGENYIMRSFKTCSCPIIVTAIILF
jgi:hypothetical protein